MTLSTDTSVILPARALDNRKCGFTIISILGQKTERILIDPSKDRPPRTNERLFADTESENPVFKLGLACHSTAYKLEKTGRIYVPLSKKETQYT
jgi:hypothetical protein